MAYPVVNIAIQEHLATTLAADKRGDLGELASRALLLNLQRLLSDFVRKQTRRIPPATQHQRRIRLLGTDDGLLDLMMNRRFKRTHEPSTHIDTLRAKRQRRSEAMTIRETARGNKRDLQFLTGTAEKDEVGDIVLADVAGTFKPVDGQEIDAQLDGRLGMANRRALVQDGRVGLLQLRDDRARAVTCRFDDPDPFVDDHLRVGAVVRGHEGREESQVHGKGVLGHGPALSNLLAQVFGGGLCEGRELTG